jgi:hypothetical protein
MLDSGPGPLLENEEPGDPACRGREVLFLLIEVEPISEKESEQYPDAYPKEYRERVERFSINYI